MFRFFLPLILAALTVTACGDVETENFLPQSQIETRQHRNGSLAGEDGGVTLFGMKRAGDEAATGSPIGINSYLWRATLDTLSFMPLISADPFGGVVITDWYEDPKTPGERFKVNAIILDKTLRADGVKVSVFKQKLEKTVWRDQQVDSKLERTLEDTILTRARQLKVVQ